MDDINKMGPKARMKLKVLLISQVLGANNFPRGSLKGKDKSFNQRKFPKREESKTIGEQVTMENISGIRNKVLTKEVPRVSNKNIVRYKQRNKQKIFISMESIIILPP